MAAIANGMSLSKLRPFGATFVIFSDYARPAIRLSAIMELPTLMVLTHDAMGDGEDGPTHQPIEQLASLRAIPGMTVMRPGDANEVVEAYRHIVQYNTGRPCWCCRGSRCRRSTGTNTRRRAASPAARTCLPMHPAAHRKSF